MSKSLIKQPPRQTQYVPQSVTHPGAELRELLEEKGMGPKEFAVRVEKPEQTITAVLNGESSITPDMAVRFEHALQVPAEYWLRRQQRYDEYQARLRRETDLQEAVAWAMAFPLAQMEKLGWLPKRDTKPAKTDALLEYFRVATPGAWSSLYERSALKVQFRISLAHTKAPQALSAWLRRGEIQASELEAPAYSDKVFREALPRIKALMAEHPADFFPRLRDLCATAGVKVVHTPCLPKAPISGATRWLGDTPLIQLSGRYKRNDSFWFTFFHEAGHILKHGKKDIFLESVEYDEKDLTKEAEADQFAIQWLFSEAQEQELLAQVPLDEDDIVAAARRYGTHPAIIIGRFQHKKLIHYSVGRDFIEPVQLDAGAEC